MRTYKKSNKSYFKTLDKLIAKNLYKFIPNKKQRRLLFKYSYYNSFKNNNYNNYINFSSDDFIKKMYLFKSLFPYSDYNEFHHSFNNYDLLDLQRYYFSQILNIYKNC